MKLGNFNKYFTILQLVSFISGCTGNRVLNCMLIPWSKNCEQNIDRLNLQNEQMVKQCRNANYELKIAEDAMDEKQVKFYKREVKKYCVEGR